MKKIVEIKKEYDALYVYWLLTDFCNYRCSYCPPNLHSGEVASTKSFPDNTQIEKFLDKIILQNKKLTVCINGGEPTTHPQYEYIVNRLNDADAFTETITNGSRPLAWWKKLRSLPRLLTISLHPEYTDLDKINELGLYLHGQGCHVKFSLIADVNNWDWVLEAQSRLDPILHPGVQARILTKHISHGVDFGKLYDYSEEHFDFIKNTKSTLKISNGKRGTMFVKYDDESVVTNLSGLDILNANEHQFVGFKCTAGQSIIAVNPDGRVRAGICGITNLGTLDQFEFLPEMVTCTIPYCKCPADIEVNKFKPTLTQDL